MSTSGGGKTKKKDDGDMLAEMLHKTSLKDKRIRKQPERLTIAHTPKKAAAPRADTKSGADELLRVARAGIYDKDEAKAMASAKEAEKIQIEKIHKIHAVLDAELTLLEKIRRQIQYRKDHFAKKNAAAAAAAALALVPRTGSVGSQDSEMKSRSRSRSASEGAQMAAPGVVLALPAAGPAPMAQEGGKKKRRAVRR
jgi:hypothetical protein